MRYSGEGCTILKNQAPQQNNNENELCDTNKQKIYTVWTKYTYNKVDQTISSLKKYEVIEKMLKKTARNYWNKFVIVLLSSKIKFGSKNISNSILYYTILLGGKK